MKLQYLGKTKVHVTFGNTRHKLYVSRYSTCDDVIHAVLAKEPVSEMKANTLAAFEQSGDIDRMLTGNSRILKIIRSWGCESSKFELIIKQKAAVLEFKKEFHQMKDNNESLVDTLYQLSEKNQMYQNNRIQSYYKSNEESKRKPCDKKAGKSLLLSRYISDVFLYNNKPKKNLSERSTGDGMEHPKIKPSRDSADGSSILLEVCRKSWELDIDTDSESDVDSMCENTYIMDPDQTADYSTDSDDYDNPTSHFDMAFVKSSAESDSDEGIDVSSVNSGDLNTSFVGELLEVNSDTCNLKDLDTAFVGECELQLDFDSDSDSEYTSGISITDCSIDFACETLDREKDKNSFIQKVFDKSAVKSEDDEMDSFMVSRLEQ